MLLHNFLFTRWAVLLEPLLLTSSAFVYCLKKENISGPYYSKKKSCVDFDFIPLIHQVNTLVSLQFILMFYVHITLCYQGFHLQDSCNNLAIPHSV